MEMYNEKLQVLGDFEICKSLINLFEKMNAANRNGRGCHIVRVNKAFDNPFTSQRLYNNY